jgi:hypothetical protein
MTEAVEIVPSLSGQGQSKNGACDQGDCGGAIFAEVLAGCRDGEAGAADVLQGFVLLRVRQTMGSTGTFAS